MKHTDGKKGFTLIEVIVSIAILGLVSVPLCTSLMKSYEFTMGTNTLLEDHLEATSIVEELMAEGISVTKYTETTTDGTSTTKIAVNDIVIDTSDATYSAEISSTEETNTTTDEDGTEGTGNYSTTITCSYTVTETEITYAYTASFTSTENYSDASVNVYPCTYTDSEDESYDGICFQISNNSTADNVAIYTYIMNFNCELTAEEDGSVEEDDDVLTLVFAPNFEYPGTSSIDASDDVTIISSDGSVTTGTYDGAGTFTADADGTQHNVTDNGNGTVTMNESVYTVTENSDGTTQTWKEADEEASPYWYDVTVAQGNVNINTSIRLATSDDDS